jgi:DNA repair protein RadC
MQSLLDSLPLRERPAWRVAYQTANCSLLELLAAVVGGDSQIETAQALLARFESLDALNRVTTEEVAEVAGIGPAKAVRIRATLELGRRMNERVAMESPQIQSPETAAAILIPRMAHLEQEHFVALLLNTRNRLIGEPIDVYRGSLNAAMIRVGEVFRSAIRANAAAILVGHNHPSGDPSPSPEDVAITKAIVEAGKLLDVDVLDHLVIGRGRYVSLKEIGLGFD